MHGARSMEHGAWSYLENYVSSAADTGTRRKGDKVTKRRYGKWSSIGKSRLLCNRNGDKEKWSTRKLFPFSDFTPFSQGCCIS